MFFFFFSSRRRHTRYIGDWSSDVCSSDLKNCKVKDITEIRIRQGQQITCCTNSIWAEKLDKIEIKLLKRSEERRVGKECRSRWETYHKKKKKRKKRKNKNRKIERTRI